MKIKLQVASVIMILALSGCASHQPQTTMAPPVLQNPAMAAPRAPKTPGSLWTDRQGSMFYDHKARDIGDIVTVAIYEKASASKEASTSTDRDSTYSAGITNFFGLENNLKNINSSIDPTALIKADSAAQFAGSGSTTRKEDLIASLTTRVVEVFPNGNLRIEGSKSVIVNNEDQLIVLTGIIRQEDISQLNIVDSKNILDARIAYTGKGVISDKQRPGWMARVVDNVWPF